MEIKILEDVTIRLDSYLNQQLDLSRSKISSMIKNESILVNNKPVKTSYMLKKGDIVVIDECEQDNSDIIPQNIPLNIVYEDDDVVVINKENGMVVHPAAGNYKDTLVNALMYHFSNLSDINGNVRPGIVHRIDAYTTGLLMVAKNNYAHDFLAKQLSEKTTYRKYVALVWGVIKEDTATIDAPIGRDAFDRKKQAVTSINSKSAVTHLRVLKRFKDVTLVELELETGRTHQIRVHMNYINHPIVNDPVYGKRKIIDETGQCLHAKELGFIHPKTNQFMKFDSDLPECFLNILSKFESE